MGGNNTSLTPLAWQCPRHTNIAQATSQAMKVANRTSWSSTVGEPQQPITLNDGELNPRQEFDTTIDGTDHEQFNTLGDDTLPEQADRPTQQSTTSTQLVSPQYTSSRGRPRKLSSRMMQSMQSGATMPSLFLLGFAALSPHQMREEMEVAEFLLEEAMDEQLETQERMRQPLAFLAAEVADIIYYHQCLHQPKASQLVEAIIKQIHGHVDCGNWELISISAVPEGVPVLPSLWAMRRKRDLVTNEEMSTTRGATKSKEGN
jgi:hypothetical protein